MIHELASVALLFVMLVGASTVGSLNAILIHRWARKRAKRQPKCPRLLHPTSNSRVTCGKPLAAHADSDGWGVCPVHGLVRETTS